MVDARKDRPTVAYAVISCAIHRAEQFKKQTFVVPVRIRL